MTTEAGNISQLFNRITDKVSRAGRNGYTSALSSLEASKNAGKTTVLKVEVASRKMKMKKLFTLLGERLYSEDIDKVADIVNNISVREIIDAIKSQDSEIKEIEDYIASLNNGRNGKKNGSDSISEAHDARLAGKMNEAKDAGRLGAVMQEKKSDDISDLAELIQDKKKEVRIRTLKQLFRYEGPQAIPLLEKSLKDKDAEVRRRAASYLGWKMAVSAAPSLIEAARDRDPAVKRALLEALGELSTPEAVPVLIEALDDRDVEIRKTAYKSLTKTTGEFIEFNPQGSLSGRFKSIQRWEKWWEKQRKA